MQKQSQQARRPLRTVMFGSWRRALASVVSVVLVAGLLNLLYWQAWSVLSGYNQMQQQATTEPIRTLIARAIEGLGTPAPVDAKTGDVYFPPAKLYLPASNAGNDGFTPATYKYSWDAAERTLTVIDVMVRQQAVTKLYTVQGLERLFEQVPYAQACSRGVMVMPAGKTPEGWERQGSIKAADGMVLYLYSDKGCSLSAGVAERLRSLKGY